MLIVAGIASGVTLVRREWGDPAPLFPVDLLRIRIFSMSIATSTVSFAAQMLAFVTLPFLFQSVIGRSAFETGLLITPWPLALGLVAPFAGRLADRVRAGLLGGVGLAVFALGLFMLSRLGTEPSALDIVWRMAMCGIGFGLFQSPNNRTIVSSAPRSARVPRAECWRPRGCSDRRRSRSRSESRFTSSAVGASQNLLVAAAMAALPLRDLACCACARRARSIAPRPARRSSTNAFRS